MTGNQDKIRRKHVCSRCGMPGRHASRRDCILWLKRALDHMPFQMSAANLMRAIAREEETTEIAVKRAR